MKKNTTPKKPRKTILWVLGICIVAMAMVVFSHAEMGYGYLQKTLLSFLFPWIIATVYAVTDEIHQYHVSGRYGTWSDVLIDSCGAVAGILIWSILMKKHGKLTDTQKQ